MEAAHARLNNESTALVEKLDRELMRKLQADMHRCGVKCCENTTSSMETVQRCLDTCSAPVKKADAFAQDQLKNFENRFQRCVMDCQDAARDKVTPTTNDAAFEKIKQNVEQCAVRCVDTSLARLPDLFKRIEEAVKKGKY